MNRRLCRIAVVLCCTSIPVVITASPAGAATGLPAKVVTFTPTTPSDGLTIETKPTVQYGATSTTNLQTSWREVDGLGNGAEKFLTTDSSGTIYDIGGRYMNFSSDEGVSWLSAQTQQPLVNAEGANAAAPNGDLIGVTWDPYGGDVLYSYKYDAASKQWLYLPNPLHTPFYDRPEVAVIPGPLTIPVATGGTQTVPYISMVSSHGSPIFYSTDGLSYENAIGQDNQLQIGAPLNEWIPTTPDPNLDWDQSQVWTPARALGGGWALDFPGSPPVEDYSPATRRRRAVSCCSIPTT